LSLAKMMLYPRNLLALDEPTNHLDIPAREVLEEALDNYDGTIIVVSHDRYFIDRVCDHLLVFEDDRLEAHLGNYSDWRARRTRAPLASKPDAPAALTPRPAARPAPPTLARGQRERDRLLRRLGSLREEIQRLEGEAQLVRAQLGVDHGGDWQKLHDLAARDQNLAALIARRAQDVASASAALERLPGPAASGGD
jgi:ATP-binding cassette subfamily F protein 3